MQDQGKMARMENQLRTVEAQIHDHEVRVREIEKTIWKAVGLMSLLQSVLTLAIVYFTHGKEIDPRGVEGTVGQITQQQHYTLK